MIRVGAYLGPMSRNCHMADVRLWDRAMSGTILSLFMLAGIALAIGGAVLIMRMGDKKRGTLMLVAALVMFANVAIWVV